MQLFITEPYSRRVLIQRCARAWWQALNKWRSTHEGKIPKTSAEKDALREMLDEMQVSETRDEENFIEAKQLARHAYAPFEIPSEVKAILADPKVQDDSTCLDPFW